MNEDFLRASTNPETWRLAAEGIAGELAQIDKAVARTNPTATLTERESETARQTAMEPARKVFAAITANQWPAVRTMFTLGQQETDMLVLLVERRITDWQTILNAKAAFGSAQDIVAIKEAADLNKGSLNLNVALTHAAKPNVLVQGLRTEGNYETVEQLFKLGADPATGNSNNGQIFNDTVEAGRADIGRLFAKYGQSGILPIDPWINAAKANRKFKLFDDLRKIQWDYGRFTALDNETLLEVKTLPDNAGVLKTVFNFASRHVNEIFETVNPRQSILRDIAFEDYGDAALEAARAKLIDMGGNPSGIEVSLRGKAPSVKAAGLSMPGKG